MVLHSQVILSFFFSGSILHPNKLQINTFLVTSAKRAIDVVGKLCLYSQSSLIPLELSSCGYQLVT